MEYNTEEYTKNYIIQAFFILMREMPYNKISVVDICDKAGIGRATFYRHFKSKEDIIIYYFNRNKFNFLESQKYYPRCKEDYELIVKAVLITLKEQKENIKLIREAKLEYLYLDYVNEEFLKMYKKRLPEENIYSSYGFAGMLFNISMAWLDNNCADSIDVVASSIVDSINFKF